VDEHLGGLAALTHQGDSLLYERRSRKRAIRGVQGTLG
jgi:hypothetical protein